MKINTLDKIHKLLEKLDDVEEEYDHLDFRINQCDSECEHELDDFRKAYRKRQKILLKLRKLFTKYLKETTGYEV